MRKPPIFIANWKMYKITSEATGYTTQLMQYVKKHLDHVYLAVPYTALHSCSSIAAGSFLSIGAQNVAEFEEGAYTGEISCRMIKDAGATFCLVGHSERRIIYKETNQQIREKIHLLLEEGVQPVLCVGETKEEREKHLTKKVLEQQLLECLDGISGDDLLSMMIAYEPVWAIGTGAVATPSLANETHKICKEILKKKGGSSVKNIPILYGGSVKVDNAKELLKEKEIDGLLVGGASLDPEQFANIILEGMQL
ncbi:MAG: triose-phosphate isomerase [Chlamydiales bacterium]|nr:triose-phosphate isomerase [Chlamydiales bacterium]